MNILVNEKNDKIKELDKIINKENYIITEIDIKEECIGKRLIRIINSYEQVKREKSCFYLEDENKYLNEKEIIEKCEIFINNNKMSFNYFYEHEKERKYEIKYMCNTQNIISLVICSLNVII